MSDAGPDTPDVPPAVADLLDADADQFVSEEAFREWVEETVADLRDDLDARDARTDALARQVETIREVAEQAVDRADRAESMAAWGGLGYSDRLERVVSELVQRARDQGGQAFITPTVRVEETNQGVFETPGVYELFDGGVSERTCRRYVSDLGDLDGLHVEGGQRGGWCGGATQKRLKMDLPEFLAAHGQDWDLDAALSGESLECDECGETFDSQDGLDEHVRILHNGGESGD